MKRITLRILNSIARFFNRMSNQEAKRIIDLYNHILHLKIEEAPGHIGLAGVRFCERRRDVV